jgi:hypothetical protein
LLLLLLLLLMLLLQEAGRGRSDCGRIRLGGFGRARVVGLLCAGREGRVRLGGSLGRRRLLLGLWVLLLLGGLGGTSFLFFPGSRCCEVCWVLGGGLALGSWVE